MLDKFQEMVDKAVELHELQNKLELMDVCGISKCNYIQLNASIFPALIPLFNDFVESNGLEPVYRKYIYDGDRCQTNTVIYKGVTVFTFESEEVTE